MNQQQLREDLNRMADRRIKQFREEQERQREIARIEHALAVHLVSPEDIPVQTEWQPNWTSIALAAVACLLFFTCVWYFGLAIAQQAGF